MESCNSIQSLVLSNPLLVLLMDTVKVKKVDIVGWGTWKMGIQVAYLMGSQKVRMEAGTLMEASDMDPLRMDLA